MSSVPVLLYHHVAPDREVTPAGFARQLDWLKANGYRTLSAAELHGHLAGTAPVLDKAVVLTFDDGYADNWVYAYPLLKARGMRAHLFVITQRIGDGAPRPTAPEGGELRDTVSAERGPAGFLTWAELSRMSGEDVFDVGSHTATHREFARERPYEDLSGELRSSRAAIERNLGRWPGTLAWPWGDFEEAWLELLPGLGYRIAFTVAPGANPAGAGGLRVRRFKVRKDDVSWLARRVALYRSKRLSAAYGALYGLDCKLKQAFKA
ncbi:MAG: polysaccharide deacetylase family protein [Elusimicrobiota bacterium]|mgnify:CR=1 FL=1